MLAQTSTPTSDTSAVVTGIATGSSVVVGTLRESAASVSLDVEVTELAN